MTKHTVSGAFLRTVCSSIAAKLTAYTRSTLIRTSSAASIFATISSSGHTATTASVGTSRPAVPIRVNIASTATARATRTAMATVTTS